MRNPNCEVMGQDDGGDSYELLTYNVSKGFECGDGSAATSPSYIYSTNKWYHVMCRHDGSTMTLWVNGVQVASSPSSAPPATSAGFEFRAGGITPAVNTWWFKGSLDDVRIYNRALSASEIKLLYSAGR
jgi:concanavalin A-like lectin/glucanase superfamily protein